MFTAENAEVAEIINSISATSAFSAVRIMERETGFEPATSTLARLHSTTELFPLAVKHEYNKNTAKCQNPREIGGDISPSPTLSHSRNGIGFGYTRSMEWQLAKYKILRKLGEGGMGEVYLAEDPNLLRTVAIKVISKRRQGDEDTEARFLREARAASSFNHPNIATIYEMGETGDRAYIVMEYVEGDHLRGLMKRGPVAPEKILDIAIQICDALLEAHGNGLIHRDIKPENILLTKNGRAKLVDFGLSKWVLPPGPDPQAITRDSLTQSGIIVGTPAYMSPEQLKGMELDSRSDIFSLAVVLYEMLAGRLPFSGSNPLEMAASILRDPVERLSSNSGDFALSLTEVLHHALEKQRDDRFASIGEFREALEKLKALSTFHDPLALTATSDNIAISSIPFGVSERTILVLPLEPVGVGEEETFFGIGLAHAIITDLARIPGLTVLSKSAAGKSRKGAEQDALALARELGAAILLEGEVMRSGQKIAVNARLTEVKTKRVIWGSQYRGDAEDMFGIQDAVCRSVAHALEVNISTGTRKQIAEARPTNLNALELLARGEDLLQHRDVRENILAAIQAFQEAVKLDPQFALAHAELGKAYWRQFQESHENEWIQKAVTACDHALVLDAGQPQVHISLAIIYLETGKTDRAIEELQHTLRLQPSSDEAHKWLGLCYQRKGEVKKAIFSFERSIEIRPGYWEHYITLGKYLYELGRYEEASDRFRQAIAVAPENHVGYNDLGAMYYMLGRYEDSVSILRRALEIHPDEDCYSNLGSSYFSLGKVEEAVECFDSAVRLDPRNDIFRRNLGDAYLELGKAERAMSEYTIARDMLSESLSVNSHDSSIWSRIAVIQAKLGLHDEARVSISRAMDVGPPDTLILYDRAVVFAIARDYVRATEYLAVAIQQGYSASDAKRDPDLRLLRQHPAAEKLLSNSVESK